MLFLKAFSRENQFLSNARWFYGKKNAKLEREIYILLKID